MPVSKPRSAVTQEALCAALMRHAGNKTAAAIHLGVHRDTVRRLMIEYGLGDKPISGGYGKPLEPNVLPLPSGDNVFRYLLTSAQNNTKVFTPFLKNLEAYAERIQAQLMVSRFTYNKTAYDNAYMAKPGRARGTDEDGCWYDQSIAPYVCDGADAGSGRYQLAPDLQWCAELNILPTAVAPLSDLDVYAGHNSAIFPHAKVAMRSMPRMPNDVPRFLYTTGTVTQLNYIQRKAGQKAEFHHIFGAVIVEVNSKGDWWARQINASSDGSFYDCPGGKVVKVSKGVVTEGHRALAINWGDVHASEIDTEVSDVNWGRPEVVPCDFDQYGLAGGEKVVVHDGAIDSLRPSYQFMHDLFSMRSRSHHEMKKFGRMYSKYVKGQDSVLDEIQTTRLVMQKAHRDWCKTIVVNSNHDRHGERWLDDADYRYDLPNVKFFLEAQLARVNAIEADQPKEWNFLEWALQKEGCPKATFLGIEESFLIGPKGHQVECGLHGDIGPNGARGSTRNLAKLGRRNNKGHDHQATIFEGTYSAGVCQLDLTYNKGPTAWSVSHIVTYSSGKRCILTQRAGRLWA